jgi:hypothetical protein
LRCRVSGEHWTQQHNRPLTARKVLESLRFAYSWSSVQIRVSAPAI